MKRMSLALMVLTVGMLLVSSCTEPSPIGAELVEGDQANIKYTDTVTLNTITVKEDSILVFDPDPSIEFNNFFVGDFTDPVLGNVKAELNAQLWPSSSSPNFTGAILDSAVLILRYDSTNSYGYLAASYPYKLGVYRLKENMDLEQKYYSNQVFDYDSLNPLGETGDFFPKYRSTDTVVVVDYSFPPNIDTINVSPHIRIHLSHEFGNELLNLDSSVYASTSAFLEHFNGIVVKALNPTKGILSFNLTSAVSNLTLFYHTEDAVDTVYRQFKYVFNPDGVKFSNFKHTFKNSPVGSFFDDKTKGDSLVFIQALSGPNIKIEIPNAEKFGDIIVNKAELIFTFAELEGDDISSYPPLDRSIIAFDNKTSGTLSIINDVIVGNTSSFNWFGGTVDKIMDDEGKTIYTYTFNISSHFQEMVDGTVENSIFIRAFPKQERAGRAILYGSKHSKYPVKFKLTYTDLNP